MVDHRLHCMHAHYMHMLMGALGGHQHHHHHHHHHHRPEPTRPPQHNCPELPKIAQNETAKVWGDPHFVGGDGGKFDVQGQAGKTYNLLTDSGLKFHGTFKSFNNSRTLTVVGSTDLVITGAGGRSHVHFNAKRDCYTVNGRQLRDGQCIVMADGGPTVRRGKDLITKTKEGYRIVQHDKGGHIDAEVHTGEKGVYNGTMPTGLMGHTFDGDNKARHGKKGHGAQGEGAIDGVVTDYEVNRGRHHGHHHGHHHWR